MLMIVDYAMLDRSAGRHGADELRPQGRQLEATGIHLYGLGVDAASSGTARRFAVCNGAEYAALLNVL